jgi:hypothetical protein
MRSDKDSERAQGWYTELGGLIAASPDLTQLPASDEALRWFGRAHAILDEMGLIVEAGKFKNAFENRAGGQLRSPSQQLETIRVALFTALGLAERLAPSTVKGSFIPIGSPHDALMSIANAFGEAKKDLFVIDPYMDQAIVNTYALSAMEGVQLRLLTGKKKYHANLGPAVRTWKQQRTTRPLEVRLAKQILLHDRLIIADSTAWSLSQSFNYLAVRSPATLQPFAEEIGKLKVEFYEDVWTDSTILKGAP